MAIADDHTLFRKGVIAILGGYKEVTVLADAGNGADLLEKIEDKLPDVVILDLEMPEMDGVVTARYLTTKYPKVKVLILSSEGEESLVDKLMGDGVQGCLLKSAEPEELRTALQHLLAGHTYPAK